MAGRYVKYGESLEKVKEQARKTRYTYFAN